MATIYVPLSLVFSVPDPAPRPEVLPPAVPTPSSPFPSADLAEADCDVTTVEDRGDDGTIDSIEVGEYDAGGLLVVRRTWRSADAAGLPYITQRYVYDGAGLLHRITSSSGVTGNQSIREFKRDSAGRLYRETHVSVEDSRVVRIVNQRYDDSGMIRNRFVDNAGDGKVDTAIEYSMKEGLWEIVTTTSGSVGVRAVEHIDVDEHGVVSHTKDTDGDGEVNVSIEYRYDRIGRLIQQWGGETHAEHLWWTIEYGKFGVTRQTRHFEDGSVDEEHLYSYDDSGRLVLHVGNHHSYPSTTSSFSYSCGAERSPLESQ